MKCRSNLIINVLDDVLTLRPDNESPGSPYKVDLGIVSVVPDYTTLMFWVFYSNSYLFTRVHLKILFLLRALFKQILVK